MRCSGASTSTFARGDVVALLGRNGSGKTTLLKLMGRLLDPAAGTVTFADGARAAYVPQNPNSLLFEPTVRREVEQTLKLLGTRDHGDVDRWLDALGLHDLAARHPRSLSGGERQRIAIAAVAVGGAPVLLLDEPTRGMDAVVAARARPGRAPARRVRRRGRARHPRRRARGALRDPCRRAR